MVRDMAVDRAGDPRSRRLLRNRVGHPFERTATMPAHE